MKRLHVHVSVNDVAESIRFYSEVFAAAPVVSKTDYAKWMLEDRETFLTTGESTLYGGEASASASACCIPRTPDGQDTAGSCCTPEQRAGAKASGASCCA